MLRWGAVGIFTTAVDYLLFVNLYGPINSVFIANLISSSVAASINYFTHHRWTFKSEQNHSRSGIKYLLNLIFWWLVSTSVIKALVVLNIDPKIVFHEFGYKGGGSYIADNFINKNYFGVPMLQWLGFTKDEKNAAAEGVPAYPHMLKWLAT